MSVAGPGAFTELVIDRCAPSNITAVDPAEDQIAYARNRPAAKRATFRTGEAQSLPFVDREFDVAAIRMKFSAKTGDRSPDGSRTCTMNRDVASNVVTP
jgi:ubiquinone/menaquinone biosynthesis C-methylase UbiE